MKKLLAIENLFLNISTSCNQKCKRCYGHLYKSTEKMMSFETAQAATSEFFKKRKKNLSLSYIMFFGGEPLINWDLIRIYLPWVKEQFKHERFRIFLFTNGMLFNNEILETLFRYDVLVFLSIDGDYKRYSKVRPIEDLQYQKIINYSKQYLNKKTSRMIPYLVLNKNDMKDFKNIIRYIHSLGFKVIAVSRDLKEVWPITKKIKLIIQIIKLRFCGIKILPYPEVACNCHNCVPKNAMVYPDGKVFDLCYVRATVLYGKGLLKKEELNVFQMGNIFSDSQFSLDVNQKRTLISKYGLCPVVSKRISSLHYIYHLIGKNLLQFYGN